MEDKKTIKDLLQQFDDMEADCGMNIQEDVEESEKRKEQVKIYQDAIHSLDALLDLIEEGKDPAKGRLNFDDQGFYNKVKDTMDFIASKAEALDIHANTEEV